MSPSNLDKAKARLVLDQPFFASLLMSMPMVADAQKAPTMGTDGKTLYYNPAWIESLPVPEIVFVLAHEVLHVAFEHPLRVGKLNHAKYNAAADYVINDVLVADRVGTMPQGGLHDSALVAKGKGTTEGVYALLPDNNGKQAMDNVMPAPGDAAAQEAASAEMKVKVIQAANAAKMVGKLSQGLARIVGEIVKPKVDWRNILRDFLTMRCKQDWTFARPKRRFMADDLCLPSLTGESLGEIVVAVDCSGSIDAKILNSFSAEIKAICEDTKPMNVHVLYFDSEVTRHDSFPHGEDFKVNAKGGGGTAFSPIWEYVDKQDWNIEACVVLTDLQCSDFGQCPSYPVLWASNDLDKAEFGQVIKIKE